MGASRRFYAQYRLPASLGLLSISHTASLARPLRLIWHELRRRRSGYPWLGPGSASLVSARYGGRRRDGHGVPLGIERPAVVLPAAHGLLFRLILPLLSRHSSAYRSDEAADESDDDDAAYDGRHRNDDLLVVAEPRANFVRNGSALADAVATFAASLAGCPIQEVLVHCNALACGELWRGTGKQAALRVTSVGVVAAGDSPHHGPALEVSRCALAGSARQALPVVPARRAVVFVNVGWAHWRGARALLLGVAKAGAGSADDIGGGKLAGARTTVLV
jgi:hypothetical protein